jgi:tetratricopeptide (TPR) repeat protein
MLRDDYIMRIIEQLGQALARVLKLGNLGQFQQALEELDQACHQFFGLDMQLLNDLDQDYLLTMMTTDGILDTDKALIAAEILNVEGDLYTQTHQPYEAARRHLKAVYLLASAFETDSGAALPGRAPLLQPLLDKLSAYQLPAFTLQKLFDYYEYTGQYARAENALYDRLELYGYDRRAVRVGIGFYHRLLSLGDAELIAGGLPRDEVEDGLAELTDRLPPLLHRPYPRAR